MAVGCLARGAGPVFADTVSQHVDTEVTECLYWNALGQLAGAAGCCCDQTASSHTNMAE